MQRMLMYGCALIASAALAATSSPAFAAIIQSDNLDRTGALLGTAPSIGGTWTITGTSVVNPLTTNGTALPMANTGQDAFSAFSQSIVNAAGTVLKTSIDINVASVGAGVGDYFTHLSDPPATTTTAFFQRLFVRPSGAGFQLGLVDTSGTGSTPTFGADVLNFNQSYHVNVDWNFVTGPTNDTFVVTVNNSITPYLNHTWTSATGEPAQVSSFNLRQGGGAIAPVLTVDNTQVEVVPEPAALALMLIGAVVGIVRRRFR